jgi:DNA-binding winged helix-turn-helix (wHTH) protein/tetratricopeptide (TPR) repeat protein
VLVQRGDQLVSKDELMKQLWPDTFVEESNLTQHISMLRKALGESPQDHLYIVTMPGRGYRFAQKAREVSDSGDLVVQQSHSVQTVTVEETESRKEIASAASVISFRGSRGWVLGAAVVALVAVASAWVVRMRRPPPLNEADLVLVADFVNTTGDPVFDGTLKLALTEKLDESPFFSIVPGSVTRKTLGLMGRSVGEPVVPPIAREVCQRDEAKAVVGGSILNLGGKYVIDLDATNCLSGASLAHQEIRADDRDQVLTQLGQLIPKLRRKLGESISSIQKFDTPISIGTTKSLTALKAYSKAEDLVTQGHDAESLPLFKMAIELDPDFAMAYAGVGSVNLNLNQPDLAAEYLRKAFELRQHASEKEKLNIQAFYYNTVTRETDKVIETYKLWADAYPNDFIPFVNLGNDYILVGQMEAAITASQQALRLNPHHASSYGVLCQAYGRASHFAEAKAICEKAVTEKLDTWGTHRGLYLIAFVEGDGPAMQREIDWFKGKPTESVLTFYQARGALGLGQLRAARELFERACALALKNGLKEQAVAITNDRAAFTADLGNYAEALAQADLAVRESTDSARHRAFATLAVARAGDLPRAEALMRELSKQPMPGTALNEVVLPTIRAAMDMDRKKPAAAIEELRRSLPYDLGAEASGMTLYYRGLAYLELKSGKEAAPQFQKVLDNHGVAATGVYWPLSRLGLARALAQTGDTENSLAQYREFLTLWKNADPDLRILNEAKAEYQKLSARSTPLP